MVSSRLRRHKQKTKELRAIRLVRPRLNIMRGKGRIFKRRDTTTTSKQEERKFAVLQRWEGEAFHYGLKKKNPSLQLRGEVGSL